MCGIAGLYNVRFDHPQRVVLAEMADMLAHRGPDGSGQVEIDNVGLGHRRLSIIDLEGGGQPMYSWDRRYVVTFNGEIFNYVELRDQLSARGSQFRTRSDTEAILEVFRHYNIRGFELLNGQFAFALYDTLQKELFLVRDRIGEKPLYYAKTGDAVVFASEVKAVLHFINSVSGKVRIHLPSLASFLSLNYVPMNNTLVDGVYALPPGTFLCAHKADLQPQSFCSADAVSAIDCSESTAAVELERLLIESARLRLRSDVPLGVFLSGGVDSSLVCCALSRLDCSATCYTANFRESAFSEASNARQISRLLSLPCQEIDIDLEREDIPLLIEQLVRHGDEPLADSSALAVFVLCRETAAHVKVVLSGDGGDEFFGGYLTYQATLLSARLPRLARKAGFLMRSIPHLFPAPRGKVGFLERLERFLRSLSLPPGAAHFAWNGMFGLREKSLLLSPEILRQLPLEDTFCELAARLKVDLARPSLRQLLLADQCNYLVNDILAKVDRMSMAHGLEVRPVYLDPRLVGFARSLPSNLALKGRRSKVLLRQLLKRMLPQYPSQLHKQGFSIPVHLWFRSKLKEFMGDLIHSTEVKNSLMINQSEVLRLWDLHQRGRRNLGFELWGVMILLLWHRRFLRPQGGGA